MRWARDLLFIGLVGGGTIALAVNLIPPRVSKAATSYDTKAYLDQEFRASVNQLNQTFQDEWRKAELHPTTPAADLLVMRRLALGLMGTIPSLEEIRRFEALPSDERLPWWLDHILKDQRFNDYFAERLARACVGTEDGPFLLYRRRRFVTWLSDQIAANRPYDALVRDLIDGTGLWTDNPATNFVSVTSTKEKQNQPDPVRLAGRVTRAFLGLRLDCAQCHNHPFANWKQADFEGLSAFFGQTNVGMKGVQDGSGHYQVEDRKTQAIKTVEPKVPFARELVPDHGTERQELAAWVTHPKNPFFARAAVNRVWALVLGRPLVEPVDNLEFDGQVPGAMQILADDFVAHHFDLRRLIRVIASSDVFHLDSTADHDVSEVEDKALTVFPMTRLRPEQVAGSVLQSSQIATIDAESNFLVRLVRFGQENEFVKRYGDSGEDRFEGRGGTIPQRLLMMNGKMVSERINFGPFNASTRIAWMAADNAKAVEAAYLATLTRRPTSEESAHFVAFLANAKSERTQRMEDFFWALINSTEFSWNH
jgi:hypothetical protein